MGVAKSRPDYVESSAFMFADQFVTQGPVVRPEMLKEGHVVLSRAGLFARKEGEHIVVLGPSKLAVFDLNLAKLAEMNPMELGGSGGGAFIVRENLLYLLGPRSFGVYDITELPSVTFVSRLTAIPASSAACAALSRHGNILYGLVGVMLLVISIENPREPALVATLDPRVTYKASGGDLTTRGDRLYIAGHGGCSVFDIRRPSVPKFVARLDLQISTESGGASITFHPHEPLAYCLGSRYLTVIETLRAAPNLRVKYKIPIRGIIRSKGCEILLLRNVLLVAGERCLAAFDISSPAKPVALMNGFTGKLWSSRLRPSLCCLNSNEILAVTSKGMCVLTIRAPLLAIAGYIGGAETLENEDDSNSQTSIPAGIPVEVAVTEAQVFNSNTPDLA